MKWIKNRFLGGRIVKTGVAVFITAFICQLLNLPVMFAVITAIVTIEPTAAASIRKGLIRFPASAIGGAIAMLTAFLLGDSAITYALSAALTIWLCHKLRLDAGMLVATLTAVAMIPGTEDHFLMTFVSRLGTTLIGLVTSTLVNFILFPPKFEKQISRQLKESQNEFSSIFKKRTEELLEGASTGRELEGAAERLRQKLDRTETLCNYQLEEWHYHKYKTEDMRSVREHLQKGYLLKQLTYQLTNLINLPMDDAPAWTKKEKDDVRYLVLQLSERVHSTNHLEPISKDSLRTLCQALKDETDEEELPVKSYIYFELLTIHALLRNRKDFVKVPSATPAEL
ncbi:FUSC family protein [Jeotgalibacillus proteolyticus]|uniref:Aromatic acid exporter family protein n=1 Tax=Jeotgalibacillus proteolyticus TaxID=2082395 RepID=A0A2S5G7G9_9BACL|nr:aromatic acid exporter family protein [Jeotgalibacillus proteolyticus]PPA68905.1 aromatic acid exporter family protein [Jeotgalibacillus proteolyticus]